MQTQRYKLPKSVRLLKAEEYQQVFKEQKKIYHHGLVIYYKKNDKAYPRLGIAVAKKYIKNAVDRNKIKRKVRETFRLHQNTLGTIDIIVVATSKLTEEKQCHLNYALNQLWQQLSLLSLSTPSKPINIS